MHASWSNDWIVALLAMVILSLGTAQILLPALGGPTGFLVGLVVVGPCVAALRDAMGDPARRALRRAIRDMQDVPRRYTMEI